MTRSPRGEAGPLQFRGGWSPRGPAWTECPPSDSALESRFRDTYVNIHTGSLFITDDILVGAPPVAADPAAGTDTRIIWRFTSEVLSATIPEDPWTWFHNRTAARSSSGRREPSPGRGGGRQPRHHRRMGRGAELKAEVPSHIPADRGTPSRAPEEVIEGPEPNSPSMTPMK